MKQSSENLISEFEFHLDHKVTEATTGVSIAYNSGTDVTTFTLPYRLNASMSVVGRYLANGETSTFVDTQGNTKTLKPGQVVQNHKYNKRIYINNYSQLMVILETVR